MKKIKLTQNKFALIDDKDFKLVSQYNWCADKIGNSFYAVCRRSKKKIYMHRLILSLKSGDGKIVDHINHNGLDNWRCNIRIVTRAENSSNRKSARGYYWNKKDKRWQAEIRINCKRIYLGQFKIKKEAANIYARAKNRENAQVDRCTEVHQEDIST